MRLRPRTEFESALALASTAVRLAGLGTAVPPHVLLQEDVRRAAKQMFGNRIAGFERIARSFATAGIERRYSVAPLAWFAEPHGLPERTAVYLEAATRLFVEASGRALAAAGMTGADIDTVVTVSSTGIATPTLEARAFSAMDFRPDVHRVPVFGLGCAGGVSGLALGRKLARATPGSAVLVVAVETCTLNYREQSVGKADIIASVLFGDGAAAAVLIGGDAGAGGPEIGDGVEHLWPGTLGIMGWEMDPTGLGVVFDRAIPPFVAAEFRAVVERAYPGMGLDPSDVSRLICHPGGRKVVEAIERTMSLPEGALDHERSVLRDYGNMSAPTVLFVLERVMATAPQGQMVMAALGPGFTASLLPISFAS